MNTGVVKGGRLWLAGLVAGAIATLSTTPVLAQQVLPSRETMTPERQAERAQAPKKDLFDNIDVGPCPFGDSDVRVTLRSVEFRGAGQTLTAQALAATYAGDLDMDRPARTICDIRDRAATLYLRSGVLADVRIPPQQISQGQLVLEVVEARVAAVRYSGDAGRGQKAVEAYLDQLNGLAPFNIDVAQRYILLASEVPGVDLQVTLSPAAEGGGAVDLNVTLSHDPYNGLLNVHNYGSKSIGRGFGLAQVDFNGVLPLGERTSVTLYSTLDGVEQRVVQLSNETRLGASGLLGAISLSYARTRPGGDVAALDLEGESFAGSVSLSYPLLRHRRQNIDLTAGFDWIDQTVEFGPAFQLTNDHLRVLFARLSTNWTPTPFSAYGVRLEGSAEVRKGLDALNASAPGSLDLSRLDGRPDAWVLRLSTRASGVIAQRLTASVGLSAQYADDPLLAYEEFSAGNFSIGRGYDPSVVSGDRAVAIAFELSTTPIELFGVRSRPYAFYDLARVQNLDLGGDNRTLSSAGVGARFELVQGVRLDLTWAKPFEDTLFASAPPPRLLVTLVATLF